MTDIKALFSVRGPDLPEDDTFYVFTDVDFVIGRTPNNDYRLQGNRISRNHLRIFWNEDDENFWVEDLNSTNGVWINNIRIETKTPQRILPGYGIQLGSYVVIFERMGGEDEQFTVVPKTDLNIKHLEEFIPSPARQMRRPMPSRPSPAEALVPKVRRRIALEKLPTERSNWLKYLPGIYANPDLDPTEFIARYLLIFETLMRQITAMIDNFDFYLSPETAPREWLLWIASWFDITLLDPIPLSNQRAILQQIGWLYLRRGTAIGLERLLYLYFGVNSTIIEPTDRVCHFHVEIPMSESEVTVDYEIIEQLIASQAPAFTTFSIEIT